MAKNSNPETDGGASDAPETPTPPAINCYVLTVAGPIKIGGVQAYRGARLLLTKDKADAVNEQMPGALQWIGVS